MARQKTAVDWGQFGEKLLSYAKSSEASGHIAVEIYRMVDQGAARRCKDWPRLKGHPGIYWWSFRDALIFVSFSQSGQLVVLEFQERASRQADFDAAALRAAVMFKSIQRSR